MFGYPVIVVIYVCYDVLVNHSFDTACQASAILPDFNNPTATLQRPCILKSLLCTVVVYIFNIIQ